MSSGPFTRTNRNTPQRNLNKSQQPTEASLTPSQPTTGQELKGGYVYKPPSRIARSSVNAVKQSAKVQQKTEVKKEEPQKFTLTKKIQQPVQRTSSFVRKPVTQVIKETTVVKTITIVTQETEIIEQVKPPTSKPYYGRTKPTIEQKTQIKPAITSISKNPLEQLVQDSIRSPKPVPNLQIKKPSPFYSYPKKITKRDSETPAESQADNKPETVISPKQIKPQTPNFSKQQAAQAPQMFSSTYSYKGKNTENKLSGVQSSQSSSNLKQAPYQNVIQAPVQKAFQTQKPSASTVIDSSPKPLVKPLLSHASRYSNKVVETQAKEQQLAESEQQVSKPPVKRSPLLAFVLHRLYTHKFASHFSQISQYAKAFKENKGNQKIHQYFERSLSRFIKEYEQNVLVRNSFTLIKLIFSKALKSDMVRSTDPKVANLLVVNKNQCIGKVLQNILPSNMMNLKESFLKIKSVSVEAKIRQNKTEAAAKILCRIQNQKMKEHWQLLCEWAHTNSQIKHWKLTRCSEINQNFRKWLLKQAWSKLTMNKLKEPSLQVKSPQIKRFQKISESKVTEISSPQTEQPQVIRQLKQKLTDLQTKLSEAQQKASLVPKQSDLRKTLQELKDQKSQISQQISTKKERNSELKQKLQALISKVSHESLSSLSQIKPENEESTLPLIHEVYMKIYKQPRQECISEENIASLWSIHRVKENSAEREIVKKWLAIQENMTLKHWINLYEGNYVDEASGEGFIGQRREAHRQIEEENEIVKKFIRSYIKERYMWEEVKSYVAAVINE